MWWKRGIFGSSRITWERVPRVMIFLIALLTVFALAGKTYPAYHYGVVILGLPSSLILLAAIEMVLRGIRTRD